MENEPSWKRVTTFSPGSEPSTSLPQASFSVERARLLLGCYRRGDANDPDTYVAAIAAVLAMYDPDTIRKATDPRTGIQSKEKFAAFMPNSGEVKVFCDHLVNERSRYARYRSLPPPETFSRKYIPPDPLPGPNGKHPLGTILSNYDEAFKLYGRPIGRFECGREKA